ncbi:MAG: DUF3473 domain-containing protein [candidate division Zixibacteria bacterium]|nr:DUF3473 domain-containing protein [candidate division Zixibacteria bacterium]
MKNILTVDLEDWYSVEIFQSVFPREQWPDLESVVERNTEHILELFHKKSVKATFFVLGWIAEKYPHLVAAVSDAGHEIACHSFYHRMVSSIDEEEFKKDTEMALNAIVKACGQIPKGYRSPSWGMRREMHWAFKVLHELGFEYDSSIFPIKHDIYGDPKSPRRPYEIKIKSGGSLIEIPASTVEFLGVKIPVAGGGWLRQFPYWFTKWGIKKLNKNNTAAMTYFHPWELDINIPRVRLDLKNSVRQYGNIKSMQYKIERLLDDFDFVPMIDYIRLLREEQKV